MSDDLYRVMVAWIQQPSRDLQLVSKIRFPVSHRKPKPKAQRTIKQQDRERVPPLKKRRK